MYLLHWIVRKQPVHQPPKIQAEKKTNLNDEKKKYVKNTLYRYLGTYLYPLLLFILRISNNHHSVYHN